MPSITNLQQLFEAELRDMYDAEKQITKALPKMIKAVTDDDLRNAFESHLEETHGQIERLEEIFAQLELKPKGKTCDGMKGILKEGASVLDEAEGESALDAAAVAAAQRVEHYEITAYGTLKTWAKLLGYNDAVALIEANEHEERAADEKLTKLAESNLNLKAMEAVEVGA